MNNPGFLAYVSKSELPFKSYDVFKKASIDERTDLYRKILEYEFKEFMA